VGEAVGWNGQVVTKPGVPPSAEPKIFLAMRMDSTRIREELDYREALPQDEALQRTVEWERAHLPEQIDPKAFDYEVEDAVLADLSRS